MFVKFKLPWQRTGRADEEGMDRLFARAFSKRDGEAVLEQLMAQTMGQAQGPNVTSEALHHMEGQRFIVNSIINRVNRGRENAN